MPSAAVTSGTHDRLPDQGHERRARPQHQGHAGGRQRAAAGQQSWCADVGAQGVTDSARRGHARGPARRTRAL